MLPTLSKPVMDSNNGICNYVETDVDIFEKVDTYQTYRERGEKVGEDLADEFLPIDQLGNKIP